jgi:hypothetical protein
LRAACFWLNAMERAAGIEPACLAWKARALPLSYARAFKREENADSPAMQGLFC